MCFSFSVFPPQLPFSMRFHPSLASHSVTENTRLFERTVKGSRSLSSVAYVLKGHFSSLSKVAVSQIYCVGNRYYIIWNAEKFRGFLYLPAYKIIPHLKQTLRKFDCAEATDQNEVTGSGFNSHELVSLYLLPVFSLVLANLLAGKCSLAIKGRGARVLRSNPRTQTNPTKQFHQLFR
ncbi:hypothetical protein G2W53_024195 [Senna tora]|uniref:Uncharacterized protein n=1 Tax=Senna tora TaxID=362788 RepID=A0A834TCW4_9FABA|nr:hypothetical protein G2W53_024195 [Senna tora]